MKLTVTVEGFGQSQTYTEELLRPSAVEYRAESLARQALHDITDTAESEYTGELERVSHAHQWPQQKEIFIPNYKKGN